MIMMSDLSICSYMSLKIYKKLLTGVGIEFIGKGCIGGGGDKKLVFICFCLSVFKAMV